MGVDSRFRQSASKLDSVLTPRERPHSFKEMSDRPISLENSGEVANGAIGVKSSTAPSVQRESAEASSPEAAWKFRLPASIQQGIMEPSIKSSQKSQLALASDCSANADLLKKQSGLQDSIWRNSAETASSAVTSGNDAHSTSQDSSQGTDPDEMCRQRASHKPICENDGQVLALLIRTRPSNNS